MPDEPRRQRNKESRMIRLLARLIEALCRYADPTVCRFANDTDEGDQ